MIRKIIWWANQKAFELKQTKSKYFSMVFLFNYECTYVIWTFPIITFGWVCSCSYPKVMTGNGQQTKVHSWLNDFLRNLYFSYYVGRYELSRRFLVLIDRVNVVFAMLHSKLSIRYWLCFLFECKKTFFCSSDRAVDSLSNPGLPFLMVHSTNTRNLVL